ncbi:MAG TPA: T9SS type A sorting domain-containing protein [Puia sp.]|nr:T9SS type A sorting domain-containing protein [Puia sp.]
MKLMPAVTIKTFLAATAILLVSGLTRVSAQTQAASSDGLPALLMGFSGLVEDNNIVLSWTMENETNSKWFVIERSSNGNSFDSVGVVAGLNNMHESNYSYTDLRSLSGYSYYRLRLVSRDGGIKYSKIVTLNNGSSSAKMQVYPNPAGAVVNYSLNSTVADQVTVEVFNLAGVVVMSHQQQLSVGVNQQSLAISTLKSGNYFLKVINRDGNNQYVQPFVKLM